MTETRDETSATDKEALIIERMKPGCICKGIRRGKIMDAIASGARSFREISEKTGIGGGSCKAERCGKLVKELLSRFG